MGYHFRQDAIGRWCQYDKYGNRVYKTPLRGSLRPRSIPQEAWNRLDGPTRKELADFYEKRQKEEREAKRRKAKSTSAAAATLSSSSCNAQSAVLIMTCLASMMSGAAEDTHIQEAVQDCLGKLQANRIAAAATLG